MSCEHKISGVYILIIIDFHVTLQMHNTETTTNTLNKSR